MPSRQYTPMHEHRVGAGSYFVDRALGLVRLRFDQTPTVEEWSAVMTAVARDAAFRRGMHFLRSCASSLVPPDAHYARHIALQLAGHRQEIGPGRYALVAAQPAMFGVARMIETYADLQRQPLRAFRIEEEALVWLSDAEPLGLSED